MIFQELQSAPRAAKILLAWVGIISTGFVAVVVGITQLDARTADPTTWWTVGGVAFLTLLLAVIFSRVKMLVKLDEGGLLVRMRPFHTAGRNIAWNEVAAVTLRKCNAFGEFGGWGIRYTLGGKKGYVWNGKHCIELVTSNGKRIVITVVDIDGLTRYLTEIDRPFTNQILQ